MIDPVYLESINCGSTSPYIVVVSVRAQDVPKEDILTRNFLNSLLTISTATLSKEVFIRTAEKLLTKPSGWNDPYPEEFLSSRSKPPQGCALGKPYISLRSGLR